MNAFARTRLESALIKLDIAIDTLDGSNDRGTYELLLRMRGDLYAMLQLLDMEEVIAETQRARTEPTVPAFRPLLRVVPT